MIRILGLLLLLFVQTGIYGQMKRGEYPFRINENSVFNGTKLIVDTSSKPQNFKSTMESWCMSRIGIEITKYGKRAILEDSMTLKIHLPSNNEEIVWNVQRMKTIHEETNSRAFIAGFSNNTKDTISFPIQDESLIAIIEAKDKNGNWSPVQFWPKSGCGNSYYSKYLFPDNTLLFTVDNNFGNQKTNMRLRLHGNDTIYVSNEFEGTVDESIFDRSQISIEEFNHILCDSILYLDKPLFGDLNCELEVEMDIEFEEIIQK